MSPPKKGSKQERVVVTGLEIVSSLGIGRKGFWKNLLTRKLGTPENGKAESKAINRVLESIRKYPR